MTNTKDPPGAVAGHAGPPPTHDPPPKDEHDRLAMTGMQSKAPAHKLEPGEPDPTKTVILGHPQEGAPPPHKLAPGEPDPYKTIITGEEPSATPWNSPGLVAPDQVGKPGMKPLDVKEDESDKRWHPDPHTEHKDDPAKGFTGGEAKPGTQQGTAHAHAEGQPVAAHTKQADDDPPHSSKGGGAKK